MLQKIANQGFADACARFGIKSANQLPLPGIDMAKRVAAPTASLWDKIKTFGGNQVGHAENLGGGLKKWLGGGPDQFKVRRPGGAVTIDRDHDMYSKLLERRQAKGQAQAWEGFKGIAPTLGVGTAALGLGAYALSGDSAEEKQRKAMMASRGY